MRRAIEISARALETTGTEPFGAVVVMDGQIVGEGINRSQLDHDPTSHGETEAIRSACRNLLTVDLSGCELYSSCEPCAMCVAAMGIAGIGHLYFAADHQQSKAALGDLPESVRFSIDTMALRADCGKPIGERSVPAEQALGEEAAKIIEAWADKARID